MFVVLKCLVTHLTRATICGILQIICKAHLEKKPFAGIFDQNKMIIFKNRHINLHFRMPPTEAWTRQLKGAESNTILKYVKQSKQTKFLYDFTVFD